MTEDNTRLSVTEAAQRLGVSVDTVRRRIKSGEVEAQRDNTGKWWVQVPAEFQPKPRPVSRPDLASAGQGGELVEYLILENEKLWDALRDRDALIRDLVNRLADVSTFASQIEQTQAQRDEAREQLRSLKTLVGQMLTRIEKGASPAREASPPKPADPMPEPEPKPQSLPRHDDDSESVFAAVDQLLCEFPLIPRE
ncbi:MAG: excisionase family DNA-binding protein [Alphaproteobacteria bacterium]